MRYRTIKRGDKTFTCAVTRKEGKHGGRTVCWPKESVEMAKELVDRLLEVDFAPTPSRPPTRVELKGYIQRAFGDKGFPRHYEVVVGNLGTVYSGRDKKKAQIDFDEYVSMSKTGYGRVAGEPVTMFCDGEPCQNHEGAPQLEGTN